MNTLKINHIPPLQHFCQGEVHKFHILRETFYARKTVVIFLMTWFIIDSFWCSCRILSQIKTGNSYQLHLKSNGLGIPILSEILETYNENLKELSTLCDPVLKWKTLNYKIMTFPTKSKMKNQKSETNNWKIKHVKFIKEFPLKSLKLKWTQDCQGYHLG